MLGVVVKNVIMKKGMLENVQRENLQEPSARHQICFSEQNEKIEVQNNEDEGSDTDND